MVGLYSEYWLVGCTCSYEFECVLFSSNYHGTRSNSHESNDIKRRKLSCAEDDGLTAEELIGGGEGLTYK